MTERALHEIRVSSAILGADLTQGQKLVYVAIRSRQGANDWCMASQRELASDIASNKSHINRSVSVLVDEGWVKMHPNGRYMKCLTTRFGEVPEPAESVRKLRTDNPGNTASDCTQSGNHRTQIADTAVRNQATAVRNQAPPSKNQLDRDWETCC